ncbi:MAG: prenyltransferase/squalene oxidase repeat-containing protein [bacterium]
MRVLSTVLILGAAAALGASSIAVAVEREQPLRTAELTPEVERAIQGGLDWMIKAQAKDGSWGKDHKVASTALGLMAFMVKGHFPDRPPYGENLSRAVRYLVSQASAMDGYIGKSMYEHGLATLAMSEVWGMSGKGEVGGVLKDAVSVILRSQNPAGGWRYEPKPAEADVSVTVMQIVALASAKEAGVMVPDSTLQRAVTYVLSCRDSSTGGFSYQPNGPPGWERTAAGVMSLMMSGQRGHQAVKTGLDYLLRQPGAIFTDSPYYFYGHYYAIQSMYQAGDKYYGDWYPRIRDALLKKQEPDGHWEDPTGIGTQMAILVLGVPYRFLPIYQR